MSNFVNSFVNKATDTAVSVKDTAVNMTENTAKNIAKTTIKNNPAYIVFKKMVEEINTKKDVETKQKLLDKINKIQDFLNLLKTNINNNVIIDIDKMLDDYLDKIIDIKFGGKKSRKNKIINKKTYKRRK
jgi:uncharacterized FlaG/YvyC family protein